MLGLVDPAATLVVNDPRGLREANEKLYALHFPELIPESLVAADSARLKAFMDTLGGEMIVKPLDSCGGAGVFHIRADDRNTNSILETVSCNQTKLVMAQAYLPKVREGDKRILILEQARGKTLLINDPRGLREANEKLYIFNFPTLAEGYRVAALDICKKRSASSPVARPVLKAG